MYIFIRNVYVCAPKNMYKNVNRSPTKNSQKQKQPSSLTIKWIRKLWYIHIMEKCTAMKMNET